MGSDSRKHQCWAYFSVGGEEGASGAAPTSRRCLLPGWGCSPHSLRRPSSPRLGAFCLWFPCALEPHHSPGSGVPCNPLSGYHVGPTSWPWRGASREPSGRCVQSRGLSSNARPTFTRPHAERSCRASAFQDAHLHLGSAVSPKTQPGPQAPLPVNPFGSRVFGGGIAQDKSPWMGGLAQGDRVPPKGTWTGQGGSLGEREETPGPRRGQTNASERRGWVSVVEAAQCGGSGTLGPQP